MTFHKFRAALLLPETACTSTTAQTPWQRHDFARMRQITTTKDVGPPIRKLWIERPRGHSKTTDVATLVAWQVSQARTPLIGYVAAADRDQAALTIRRIEALKQANPQLLANVNTTTHSATNTDSGAKVETIATHTRSSWGILPAFVVCDELTHWTDRSMWDALASAAAKRTRAWLIVATNAGAGRDWQWNLREHVRRSRHWHFSSLHGPQAPWITDDALAEQRELLPQELYERYWLNVWQHHVAATDNRWDVAPPRDGTFDHEALTR